MKQRPVPGLSPALMLLAADLLERASRTFSSHVCNDQRIDGVPGLDTPEARASLDLAYHAYNGDPEEHDPARDSAYQCDFAMMDFLAAVLRREASGQRSSPPAPE